MNRVDQCLHLIDDIADCYGIALHFSFFCRRIHNFGCCQDLNCDVRLFIETLIDNIRSKCLMEEKKRFLCAVLSKERERLLFFT